MTKRVNLSPEQRRSQLLDCAQALFFERGYEGTTIHDILARAKVSKGGLYHHFHSKEEILEALCVRLAEQSLAQLTDLMALPALTPLSRLNAVLARLRKMKVEDAPALLNAFATLFRPENIVLYYRAHRALVAAVTPVFARIIEEGRLDGTFRVIDSTATAQLLLHMGTATHDVIADALQASSTSRAAEAADALEAALSTQGIAMDRILGVPDGSVHFVEPGFAYALLSVPPPEARSRMKRSSQGGAGGVC